MKISLNQTEMHDLKDFIARFYVTKNDNKEFNALLVRCKTRHYRTKLKNATRLYFVVEGNGEFIIDNHKESAEVYDLFIIHDGQIYEYSGVMKLIEVNVPATDGDNEEKLE